MNVAALEGEDHGILCNAIMPSALGRVSDEMLKYMDEIAVSEAIAMARDGASREKLRVIAKTAMGAWASPAEHSRRDG